MTYQRLLDSGSGQLGWRISIESWPADFVSKSTMVTTSGRQRLDGLSVKGCKLSERTSDIARAKFDVQGMKFNIADVGKKVTYALARTPQTRTWLTLECDDADTTIAVGSTAGFESTGYFWIDSECVAYSGTTSTTFTGCTRGAYDTLAQYHYINDGTQLRYPEVCDYPPVMLGRRVRLYAYGRNDSPTGTGTQVFLGIVAREPRFDGLSWSISVDPITNLLRQTLGGDLAAPLQPRGIYFPASNQWNMTFSISTNEFPGLVSETVSLKMFGFYETQDAFVSAVNDEIDASDMSSWTTQVRCVSDPAGGYYFTCQTAASTPLGVGIRGIGPKTEPQFAFLPQTLGGDFAGTVDASTTYYYRRVTPENVQGAGTVPRGAFGADGAMFPAETDAAAGPDDRIYVGAIADLSGNITAAAVKPGDGDERLYFVTDYDNADRWISLILDVSPTSVREPTWYFNAQTLPQIRLGRDYVPARVGGYSSVATLMSSLIDGAPEFLNLGSQPGIQATDIDETTWSDVIDDGASSVIVSRRYLSFASLTLEDIVLPELQIANAFIGLDSTGRMVPRTIRFPSTAEPADSTIDGSVAISTNGRPVYERAGLGMINTVLFKTGYSATEDKYEGPDLKVRDVGAFGQTPQARTLSVQPKSSFIGNPTEEQGGLSASAFYILGGLSNPYAVVTIGVPWSRFNVYTGSIVSVTSIHIPDDDGSLGVTSKKALVIGREFPLDEASGSLTLLVAVSVVSGYAQSALVFAQDNDSGNIWTITADTKHCADGADNHFQVDDRVRVYRYDSATPGIVLGTVIAPTGNPTTDVTVEFDGAWTPGADEWMLESATSSTATITDHQRDYSYVAGTDGRVDFNPDPNAPAYKYEQ